MESFRKDAARSPKSTRPSGEACTHPAVISLPALHQSWCWRPDDCPPPLAGPTFRRVAESERGRKHRPRLPPDKERRYAPVLSDTGRAPPAAKTVRSRAEPPRSHARTSHSPQSPLSQLLALSSV